MLSTGHPIKPLNRIILLPPIFFPASFQEHGTHPIPSHLISILHASVQKCVSSKPTYYVPEIRRGDITLISVGFGKDDACLLTVRFFRVGFRGSLDVRDQEGPGKSWRLKFLNGAVYFSIRVWTSVEQAHLLSSGLEYGGSHGVVIDREVDTRSKTVGRVKD
jgi:hypothetical protein